MSSPSNIDPEQQTPSFARGEKQEDKTIEKTAVEIQVGDELTDGARKSSKQRWTSFTTSLTDKKTYENALAVLIKFARFSGPGAVITVAYVDPDNLQSNLTSGAEFKFKLLFMILFSNVVAVFLQVHLRDTQITTIQLLIFM